MPLQLLPKSTTLDDLERPYRTLLLKWCVFRSSSRKFETNKNVAQWFTFRRYKIIADVRGGYVARGLK